MNAIENEEVCASADKAMRWGGEAIAHIPGLIKRIIELKAWRVRQVRTEGTIELNSLRELITEKPLKGWGTTIEKVQKYIEHDPDLLVMFRKETLIKPDEQDRGNRFVCRDPDNISTSTNEKYGTSKAYTLDRLQHQAPELYEEVKAGKLSANAAAIKAGFRKKDTPLEAAIKAFNKLSEKERLIFFDTISN